MTQYSTSQIANMFGLHPNTIRLYEKWGVLSPPMRQKNGYRVFTAEHVKQVEIVRLALKAEVLQNGLRKQAIGIIQTIAKRNYVAASQKTDEYLSSILSEVALCDEAAAIASALIANKAPDLLKCNASPYMLTAANSLNSDSVGKMDKQVQTKPVRFTRAQAAEHLHITIDALRNWEMNGLLKVKRRENGYRIYNEDDIRTLKLIRVLRVANYSLTAILRTLNALAKGNDISIKTILNTPDETDYIVSVCDNLAHSLDSLYQDATLLKKKIEEIIKL